MQHKLPTPSAAEDKLHRPFQRRKQLERDIEHITAEMYRRNRELAETNKMLSLLQTIDALALESHASLKMVCEHITEAIVQVTEYDLVALFTRNGHVPNELMLAGWSGNAWLGQATSLRLRRPLHLSMTQDWLGSNLERSRLLTFKDLSVEELAGFLGCSKAEVQTVQQTLDLRSVYVVKLLARRRLVGLLVVGFRRPVAELAATEVRFMDRLSDSIGVALDNKLLFEENQYVLRKLKESNAKLKALDEAKDDFISMASHQLRTPLTSVKGYISMVLEGDAGKVNAEQRKMLDQSFTSAQRMVYLIADLLNVSRLKTGKFLIENVPVNLAELVEQETAQLKETAAARKLKLIYKKPKQFPELLLDETKTRQVIMNFIDNAIYYTPAGGRITVTLIDKPATVELRVHDNGIGVPKREQPHLFTKFYRAGNARQARPDGTGLGLFMAKKVIIAQGGSLLFESQEGKGSTFGFTFSKRSPAASPEATAVSDNQTNKA